MATYIYQNEFQYNILMSLKMHIWFPETTSIFTTLNLLEEYADLLTFLYETEIFRVLQILQESMKTRLTTLSQIFREFTRIYSNFILNFGKI